LVDRFACHIHALLLHSYVSLCATFLSHRFALLRFSVHKPSSQDSEVYSIVLNRLDPLRCALITDESLLARAGRAINNAKAIGADVFLKPKVSNGVVFSVRDVGWRQACVVVHACDTARCVTGILPRPWW
jgi:hypothetical protein